MRRHVLLILFNLAATVPAGCGSGDSPSGARENSSVDGTELSGRLTLTGSSTVAPLTTHPITFIL